MCQYAHATLHDRVSTRPFLTAIEKRWFAFQLLHALAECHARGVTHGDIKRRERPRDELGWAFLSDFATFKPAALPADNPADYSYFFDTGGETPMLRRPRALRRRTGTGERWCEYDRERRRERRARRALFNGDVVFFPRPPSRMR